MHITSGQKLDTALRHTTLMMCDAKLRPSPLTFKILFDYKPKMIMLEETVMNVTSPCRIVPIFLCLVKSIKKDSVLFLNQVLTGFHYFSKFRLTLNHTLLKYRIYFGDFQRHKMSSITSLPSFSGSHLVQYEKSVCGTISFKLRKNKKESRVNALYLQRLRVSFIF